MVAGMYQTIARAHEIMPWRRPVQCWQLVSHKFMRPLVPLWMISAFVVNIALVVTDRDSGRWLVLLLLQGAFYVVALLGRQSARQGMLARALYLPTFLLNSNVAALQGLYRFTTRQQTTHWTRLRRRV
jgi:hypothetical protein